METALKKLNVPKIKYIDWHDTITNWANTGGFQQIGEGLYGTVYYRKGDKYAVKVFDDKAYFEWVKLCTTKLKGNPWVPVFKGKPILLNAKYKLIQPVWAIRIEKLNESKKTDSLIVFLNKVTAWISLRRKPDYNDKRFDSNLIEVMQQLDNLLQMDRFVIDLHQDNIMKRGKQLVIIDPIAE